jgi:hypothetical protein
MVLVLLSFATTSYIRRGWRIYVILRLQNKKFISSGDKSRSRILLSISIAINDGIVVFLGNN